MDRSSPGRAILLFLTAFLILMVVLPLLYTNGSFAELDGTAGSIGNWDKLSFADPLTRAIYSLGDLLCHQETARSFIINGSQMAFCQRDVSVLIGVMVGLMLTDKKLSLIPLGDRRLLPIGILMVLSTFVEWGIEYVFDTDILAARVATGILAGIGIAILFQYFVTKEYEKIMGLEKGV
jgi:uncharacterized membrane protein